MCKTGKYGKTFRILNWKSFRSLYIVYVTRLLKNVAPLWHHLKKKPYQCSKDYYIAGLRATRLGYKDMIH